MNEKAHMTDAAGCRVAWELRMAGKTYVEIAEKLGLGGRHRAREMVERGAIGAMDELGRLRHLIALFRPYERTRERPANHAKDRECEAA
jgi:hypothetical protein